MADFAHTPGSNYADPGYQKDKKKRYPLSTKEHVRAALAYINMPRNSSKYTSEQLAHIKGKIRAAAKKFGIDISDKSKSSLVTAEFSPVVPKLTPPESTTSHFYTTGRMITYNEPNYNGLVFFREDCSPKLETLKHSLADIAHVKAGNGLPPINGQSNATIGSIFELHEDNEGIDITCKNDRDVVEALGFTEEDFKPIDGLYSSFSQESEFSPASSPVIAVRPGVMHNINPATDIVYEMSPDEARARSLSTSFYDASTGKWNYQTDEDGNTLFIRLRPISFSGVGHVVHPADQNAAIYTSSACVEGEKTIGELYPRSMSDTFPSLDDPGYLPPGPDVSGGDTSMFDSAAANDDFIQHPDLNSASKDYSSIDDNTEGPDDHYAAVYYQSDKADDPTQPHIDLSSYKKTRAFRIRDKKGELDRPRMISAYHALTGMRGNTALSRSLPPQVAHHALAVIRQGLSQTKPKETKTVMSDLSNPGITQDIAALEARATALSQEKETATAAYQTLTKEFSDFKTAQTELVDTIKAENDALKTKIAEFEGKALCSARLAALEAVHPFSAEEKADAEKFGEFVKSLASVSEDRMETLLVSRELQKAKSEQSTSEKALSSLTGGRSLSPAPTFEGGVYKSQLSIEELI